MYYEAMQYYFAAQLLSEVFDAGTTSICGILCVS